jgi:hypothetical protein
LAEYRGKEILEAQKQIGNYKVTIIDNGQYQLAFVPLSGWDNVSIITCEDLHPVSRRSKVIQANVTIKSDRLILKTLLLWKKIR